MVVLWLILQRRGVTVWLARPTDTAVLRDVRNELLSPAKAVTDYGVVVDVHNWTVDLAATAQRRAAIKAARGWSAVPKVQWHDPLPRSTAAE